MPSPAKALLLVVACSACGGQSSIYNGQIHSSSMGYAAANVAVGGVLYAVAGGCKISGCPTNTQCNTVTERCDPVKCSKTECAADEVCDETSGRCLPANLSTAKPSSSTTTPAVPTPITGPNALP
ncbi:MAG: hypothetical protein ACXVEF_15680 [Polyangiales bacterium]